MSAAGRTSCQSIQPAGTWWGEPAGEEVLGCHAGLLFLATEPNGRPRTWGEGWGLGRETPGSETLDPTATFILFNLDCAEAAVFLGKVTVRPLVVVSLLFGNYHAWMGGSSNLLN